MNVKYLVIYSFALFLLFSCKKEEENDSEGNQRERIESYLSRMNTEYTVINGVYRISLNEEPVTGVRLDGGDSLYFNYAFFTFRNKPDSLLDTNVESIALEYNFDTRYLDFSERGIIYGGTDILDGLERGLQGCQGGDTLMLFVPSKYAYGNKMTGMAKKSATIAIFVSLEKVVKN